MQYDWIDGYWLAKSGVEKDYKEEWQATRYMLRGKMFAMIGGDKQGKPIVTMKLEPAFNDLLRQQYPHIVPGYYCNKQHWSSLYVDGDVPENIVRDMAEQAYKTLLSSFSKKVQQEISGETQ